MVKRRHGYEDRRTHYLPGSDFEGRWIKARNTLSLWTYQLTPITKKRHPICKGTPVYKPESPSLKEDFNAPVAVLKFGQSFDEQDGEDNWG